MSDGMQVADDKTLSFINDIKAAVDKMIQYGEKPCKIRITGHASRLVQEVPGFAEYLESTGLKIEITKP